MSRNLKEIEGQFRSIIEEAKKYKDFWKANHYDVLGIAEFYEPKRPEDLKNEIARIATERDQQLQELEKKLDEDDFNWMKKQIPKAKSVLQSAESKAEYDKALKHIKERDNTAKGPEKYGFPSVDFADAKGNPLLTSDDLASISDSFKELKIGTRVSSTIRITNKSGGILSGDVYVTDNPPWIDVTPVNFHQSQLPLDINIAVSINPSYFTLSDQKISRLVFSYNTDSGKKIKELPLWITTEGLSLKVQRLSRISIAIFGGLYTILAFVLMQKQTAVNFFGSGSTNVFNFFAFLSIPLLIFTLWGFNKHNGAEFWYNRHNNLYRAGFFFVLLMLFFTPELFLLFVFGIIVIVANKKILSLEKYKNVSYFTPLIGLLIYAFVIFQFPDLSSKFVASRSVADSSENSETKIVKLLKDCTVREEPSLEAASLGIGKVGTQFYLMKDSLIAGQAWLQIYIQYENDANGLGYILYNQDAVTILTSEEAASSSQNGN